MPAVCVVLLTISKKQGDLGILTVVAGNKWVILPIISVADTSMPFDFEPLTTANPTEHGAATTGELCTTVKLITLSTADMVTSPFARHRRLRSLKKELQTWCN